MSATGLSWGSSPPDPRPVWYLPPGSLLEWTALDRRTGGGLFLPNIRCEVKMRNGGSLGLGQVWPQPLSAKAQSSQLSPNLPC